MRAVDRALCNVASNVRSPTLQKRRTAIALIPHSRKYGYIPIENTGFVGSIQRLVTVKVLSSQIQKLFVSRKFSGSSFANEFFYLPVGKRLILIGNIYTTEPQDFF